MKYFIDNVEISDVRTDKKDRQFRFIKLSIGGKDYSRLEYNLDKIDQYNQWEGTEKELLLEDNGKYKNWRFPGKNDSKIQELEERVSKLEQRMDKAAKFLQK